MIRRALPLLVFSSVATPAWAAPPAGEQEPSEAAPSAPEPLVWEPGWRRFGWANAVVIGAGLAAIGTALLVGPDRDASRFPPGSVDQDFRRWVRPTNQGTRQAFRHASDAFLAVNVVNAAVVDPLIHAAWRRNSPDVAWQLVAIDAQVLAVATAVQLWTANLASRERPYARLCGTDELSADDSDCTSDYRYRSFYSGHTSFSFALAAATCTHHAHLPLYEGGASWVPCATGLAFAAATGASRILADQHYLSDVLVGAATGSAIGWLIPWLHYAAGERPRASGPDDVRMTVVPFGKGIALVGTLP